MAAELRARELTVCWGLLVVKLSGAGNVRVTWLVLLGHVHGYMDSGLGMNAPLVSAVWSDCQSGVGGRAMRQQSSLLTRWSVNAGNSCLLFVLELFGLIDDIGADENIHDSRTHR
jgi:hypothetical protein